MGKPWFGSKTYGIGLAPKSPAGWASLAIYALAMIVAGPALKRLAAPAWILWAVLAGLTIVMLALVFIKSDRQPWRWRWGGR